MHACLHTHKCMFKNLDSPFAVVFMCSGLTSGDQRTCPLREPIILASEAIDYHCSSSFKVGVLWVSSNFLGMSTAVTIIHVLLRQSHWDFRVAVPCHVYKTLSPCRCSGSVNPLLNNQNYLLHLPQNAYGQVCTNWLIDYCSDLTVQTDLKVRL